MGRIFIGEGWFGGHISWFSSQLYHPKERKDFCPYLPLDSKAIKPINPKGNQPWIFIGRTDAGAVALIRWPPWWPSFRGLSTTVYLGSPHWCRSNTQMACIIGTILKSESAECRVLPQINLPKLGWCGEQVVPLVDCFFLFPCCSKQWPEGRLKKTNF